MVSSYKKDLTGLVFGHYTVIAWNKEGSLNSPNNSWICRCVCGVVKSVVQHTLVNGKAKSCGCRGLSRIKQGVTYGRLTPLEIETSRKGRGRLGYWICRCSCGVTKSIRESHLIDGSTVSCGCIRRVTNEYEEYTEDTIIMYATNTGKPIYIDKTDLAKVKDYAWHEDELGYIRTNVNKKLVQLNRYILGVTDSKARVHYKDKDKRNNRRENFDVRHKQTV